MSPSVLFDEAVTGNGLKIGIATLNKPSTLNGLTLDMCELLGERLRQWATDDGIVLVVLRGAGDRAFCAGGDLHAMYQGMKDNTGGAWDNAYAREFFASEYRLDYQIHSYPKPLLCWGSGIVMGGGVGLMMGASHRVVTETTRYAMPEISIGLFPDVGGTWMLSRLPGGVGLFMALTGAQLGASDCLVLGLADYIVPADGWEALQQRIIGQAWSTDNQSNHEQLRNLLLASRPAENLPPGPLQIHLNEIRRVCDGFDLSAIGAGIAAWAQGDDPWLRRAGSTFVAGSPGSARLSYALLRRARLQSLADVFRQEYIVSLQCGVQGDLQEGIRALLIDKDKQPAWNPPSLETATEAWVQRFFQRPWPASVPHPLSDLGAPADPAH